MLSLFAGEKLRFIIVGFLNTGLDFILLNILTMIVDATAIVANTISVTIGITISYLLNHTIVFKSPEPLSIKKYLIFFSVTGFSSILVQNIIIQGFAALTDSSTGQSLFVFEQLGEHQQVELNIAKAVAVAVGMVWNFILYKYVIFKNKNDTRPMQVEEKIYD